MYNDALLFNIVICGECRRSFVVQVVAAVLLFVWVLIISFFLRFLIFSLPRTDILYIPIRNLANSTLYPRKNSIYSIKKKNRRNKTLVGNYKKRLAASEKKENLGDGETKRNMKMDAET